MDVFGDLLYTLGVVCTSDLGHWFIPFSTLPVHQCHLPVDVFGDLLSTLGVVGTCGLGHAQLLHPVVDVTRRVADVDRRLLFVTGQHPHL